MPLQRGLRPEQTQFFFFICISKAKSRKRAIETICATFSFPCLFLSPLFFLHENNNNNVAYVLCVCGSLSGPNGQTVVLWQFDGVSDGVSDGLLTLLQQSDGGAAAATLVQQRYEQLVPNTNTNIINDANAESFFGDSGFLCWLSYLFFLCVFENFCPFFLFHFVWVCDQMQCVSKERPIQEVKIL